MYWIVREACSPEHMLATDSDGIFEDMNFLQIHATSCLFDKPQNILVQDFTSRRFVTTFQSLFVFLIPLGQAVKHLCAALTHTRKSLKILTSGKQRSALQQLPVVRQRGSYKSTGREGRSFTSVRVKWVEMSYCICLPGVMAYIHIILIQIFHPLYLQQEFAAKWCPVH